MTRFLTVDDAIQVIDRLGFHVRDAGLLAAAIARPSATLFGADAYPTFDLKAASLLESLARDHPLADGNKRTAWALLVAFLWINRWVHDFDVETAFELVVGVADGSIPLSESEARIAAHRVARS